MNNWVLTPAYGRRPATAAEVKELFFAGKDFQLAHPRYMGAYCSIRDFENTDCNIELRYGTMGEHCTAVKFEEPK